MDSLKLQIDDYFSNLVDNYVLLWDIIDDNSEIFVPVIVIEDEKEKRRYMLFTENKENQIENSLVTHVFINDKEATTYRKHHENNGIVFVKMKLDKLYQSLDRYFKKNKSEKFLCMLSTIDTNGKARSLTDIWCNKTDC